MRITHLGHACLLIEVLDQRVLIDPGTYSHGFEELTGLTAVLITHEHPDHLDISRLPTLLEANDGAALLAEPETSAQLTENGFDARPLHVGVVVPLGALRVTPLGGEHALVHPDLPPVGNVGLLLEADGEPRLFVPGDAHAVTPEGVDVAAVPVSGPWISVAAMIDFVRAVGAGVNIPIHDTHASEPGRALVLSLIDRLTPDEQRIVDLRNAGATTF